MKVVAMLVLVLGLSMIALSVAQELPKNKRFYWCGGPGNFLGDGACREDKSCRQRFGPSFGGFCVKDAGEPDILEDGLAKNVIIRRLSGILDAANGIDKMLEVKSRKPADVRCLARSAKMQSRELANMLDWLSRVMANPQVSAEEITALFGTDKASVDQAKTDLLDCKQGLNLVNIKTEPDTNADTTADFTTCITAILDVFQA